MTPHARCLHGLGDTARAFMVDQDRYRAFPWFQYVLGARWSYWRFDACRGVGGAGPTI